MEDISNAYIQWHSSQDSLEETAETSTIDTDQVSTSKGANVNDFKEEDDNNSISEDSANHVETSTSEINTAAEAALENNIDEGDDNSKSDDTDNVVESNSESDNKNEGERIRKRDILKRTLLGILK